MKLKGFTILELILGMLLTSILFSIVILAYKMFNQQYTSYETLTEENLSLNRLHSLLQEDIYRADYVLLEGNWLQCIKEQTTFYKFTKQFTLREIEGRTDTFHFSVIELRAEFQNQAVDFDWVEDLELQLQFGEKIVNLTFRKTYSKQQLYYK
ncbi:MAG: hypothetical protein MK212_17530 [Saprospiraceae bacterium]|nr:hypothetical protein [Saprospiraceae bacterium]